MKNERINRERGDWIREFGRGEGNSRREGMQNKVG